MTGQVVVLSGPSGVGKTTVCDELLKKPQFARVITATTRPPRAGEVDGVDYIFLSKDRFLKDIEAGLFLEHAEVFGNLYGTPRNSVTEFLQKGQSVLLNIDVQGAETLRQSCEFPISTIFVLPPSLADLEKRLRGRSTDSEEVIQTRLNKARVELAELHHYDHFVINDHIDDAVASIFKILGIDPSESPNLEDKKQPATILLGVMGSIAAYKAADLTSKLVQKGHDVHVVMTDAATKLVDPNTFLYLSGNRVHQDMFDENQIGPIEHIALTDRADLIVLAPTTANGLGQLAHGLANNMLMTMLLAANCSVLICPAMNPRMWSHPIVQENVKKLRDFGYRILTPDSGRMACGHTGQGRLAEPPEIVAEIEAMLEEQFKVSG
ncbi:MAG: guanylate kinase [Planctomycetota bacterium]|nr:guanylate kinase [Planctomycetota bacterium]